MISFSCLVWNYFLPFFKVTYSKITPNINYFKTCFAKTLLFYSLVYYLHLISHNFFCFSELLDLWSHRDPSDHAHSRVIYSGVEGSRLSSDRSCVVSGVFFFFFLYWKISGYLSTIMSFSCSASKKDLFGLNGWARLFSQSMQEKQWEKISKCSAYVYNIIIYLCKRISNTTCEKCITCLNIHSDHKLQLITSPQKC